MDREGISKYFGVSASRAASVGILSEAGHWSKENLPGVGV